MYTKLFPSIVTSSVWAEDSDTRVVFITLLAMKDADGFVSGVPSGLARLANVSLPACTKALKILSEPDLESQTQEYGGRRIEAVEGGWFVLNHAKYRDRRDADTVRAQNRERQRRKRARDRDESRPVTPCHAESRYTDTETETEIELQKTGADAPGVTFHDCMGSIRAHWSPDEATLKKQGSQLKALGKRRPYDEIQRAIHGLALLHSDGVCTVPPHMGLLYHEPGDGTDAPAVHLYTRALERYNKHTEARRGPTAHETTERLGNIMRQLENPGGANE